MSARFLATLLVGALACFVALGVLWPEGRSAPERAVALEVGGADLRGMETEGEPASSAKAVLEDSATPPRSTPAREAVPEPPANHGFTHGVTRKLRGTIHFPEGTPEDERCELVLRVSFSLGLSRAQLSRMMPPELLEVARLRVHDGEEFELPLPERAYDVQLDVDARYLFLAGGAVSLDEQERLLPIELKPRLGGWVTLKLLAPPSYSAPPLGADFAAAALVGIELLVVEDKPGPWNARNPKPREHAVVLDADATAELHGVDPELPLKLQAGLILTRGESDLSPFAVPLGWSAEAAAGEHIEVSMQLAESSRVAGVVLDPGERPIPRAMIEVETHADGFTWQTTRAADASGRFDLRGIPGQPISLRVRRIGYQTVFVGESSLGTDMRIVLPVGPRMSGTVRLPGGEPVIGLRLAVLDTGSSDWPASQSVLTDGHGHFEIMGSESTTYTIKATARVGPHGFAEPMSSASDHPAWQLEVLNVTPQYNNELELEMRPVAPIRLQVLDEAGQPVSNFIVSRVAGTAAAQDPSVQAEHERSVSSPDGSFEWTGVDPGTWTIWVHANGFGHSTRAVIHANQRDRVTEFILRL